MQDRILKALIFIAVAAGFLVYSTFFIVKETQQAIVLQLGEPKKFIKMQVYIGRSHYYKMFR